MENLQTDNAIKVKLMLFSEFTIVFLISYQPFPLWIFIYFLSQDSQLKLSFIQKEENMMRRSSSTESSSVEVFEVAGLSDKKLQAALQTMESTRVWNLDFSLLETPWDAFGGFQCKSEALKFEERASRLLQDWCCRFKEEAEKYKTTEKVKLHMIPNGREFSKYSETESC